MKSASGYGVITWRVGYTEERDESIPFSSHVKELLGVTATDTYGDEIAITAKPMSDIVVGSTVVFEITATDLLGNTKTLITETIRVTE